MEWDMILTDGINYVDILRKPIKNPYNNEFQPLLSSADSGFGPKSEDTGSPRCFFVRAPQRIIINNFAICADIPALLGVF